MLHLANLQLGVATAHSPRFSQDLIGLPSGGFRQERALVRCVWLNCSQVQGTAPRLPAP